MLTLSKSAERTIQRRLAAGMATAAPRIGDTKVMMSPLEKGNYINYQRIEDNLAIVRKRYAFISSILSRLVFKHEVLG